MLGTLFASFAAIETSQVAARIRRAAVSYALAALCALVGVGFLLLALFIFAGQRFGFVEAGVAFGAIFLAISIVTIVVHRISSRVRERRAAERRSVEMKTIAGAAAVALLPMLLKRGSGAGLLLGPLAALAAFAIIRENRNPRPDND